MLFRAFDETITTTVRFGVVCMCSIRRSSDVKPTTLILAFFLVLSSFVPKSSVVSAFMIFACS
jgi:hypothetical protein